MADGIRATPRQNQILGLLADRLKQAQQFGAKPFGYENPPVEMLLNLLGVPAVQQTLERMSYGEPLTTGRGMTTQVRPEAMEAAMTLLPMAAGTAKATKGLPVGASIKDVSKGVFEDTAKYHQKVPEVKSINIDKLKRMNSGEVAEVSDEVAAKMDFSKPIEVSVFSDGELRIVDGHHRVAAAKKLGIKSLPVDLQAINAKGATLNKLALESTYPQQSALDLAQQRAALPVEQGGLGLPANNTAEQRAAAMGFDTPALHGSGSPDIQKFDPSLVGTKAGNPFDNYMWATSSPEAASGYSLNTNQFAQLPETKILNEKIGQLGKDISKAYSQKNFDQVGDLRKNLSVLMEQKSKLYKDFETGKFVSEKSTVYPVLLQGKEFMPYDATGQNWMKVNRQAIDESQLRGFQGVAIQNVKDNPNSTVGDIVANTYATENPDLIRSRFAAFDPFRKTAATAALMGVAAPDLLAQEVDYTLLPPEKKKELLQSLLGQ